MTRTRMLPVWLIALVFVLPVPADAAELLLLSRYAPGTDISGWYMSEKLDGIRAYWDGHQLLSRQGNVFAAPDWFTAGFPPFPIDGELWIARQRFEEVASITSRKQPHSGWRKLSYNIFEVPEATGNLDARLDKLRQYLALHPIEHLRVIPQVICRGRQHLQQHLRDTTAAGGEGLVLRDPDAPYETGRSRSALKVKQFDDMEGRVIGYRPGKGKYAGMTGALRVEIDNRTRFYIGSGMSDAIRADPPAIGSWVTFRHQGFTREGTPRFASFLRTRYPSGMSVSDAGSNPAE